MSENPVNSLYQFPSSLLCSAEETGWDHCRSVCIIFEKDDSHWVRTGKDKHHSFFPGQEARARSSSDLPHLTHREVAAANDPENHFQTERTRRWSAAVSTGLQRGNYIGTVWWPSVTSRVAAGASSCCETWASLAAQCSDMLMDKWSSSRGVNRECAALAQVPGPKGSVSSGTSAAGHQTPAEYPRV